MNQALLFVIVMLNALMIYLFIPNDGFIYSFFAALIISFVFAPLTAIEYLLIEGLFGLFYKKE